MLFQRITLLSEKQFLIDLNVYGSSFLPKFVYDLSEFAEVEIGCHEKLHEAFSIGHLDVSYI